MKVKPDTIDIDTHIFIGIKLIVPKIYKPAEILWQAWRSDWQQELRSRHRLAYPKSLLSCNLTDFSYLCSAMTQSWEDVFEEYLSRQTLDTLHKLRRYRNKVSHGDSLNLNDLDSFTEVTDYLSNAFGDLLEELRPTPPTPPTPPAPPPTSSLSCA